MLIKVTANDIKIARKLKPLLAQAEIELECPVARAVKRKLNGPDEVRAEKQQIVHGWHMYRLPLIARRFIRDFDNGKRVKPFEFELPD